MNNAFQTVERQGFKIEISYDELAADDSPREWDNCSVLVQIGRGFVQPDKPDCRADSLVEAWDRYNRDLTKVERYARAFLNAVAVDWWDDPRSASRIVGMIDRETATKEGLNDPAETLKAEIKEYAAWANGEVYVYVITGPNGEVESCGGYIGDSDYALSEANESVDAMIAERHAKRVDMYRALVNAR